MLISFAAQGTLLWYQYTERIRHLPQHAATGCTKVARPMGAGRSDRGTVSQTLFEKPRGPAPPVWFPKMTSETSETEWLR